MLIDQGSQLNFITKSIANWLTIKIKPVQISVKGVGGLSTETLGRANVRIHSIYDTTSDVNIETIVMKTIVSDLPSIKVMANASFGKDLQLADLSYAQPGKIEVLLGVGVLVSILKHGYIHWQQGWLIAQETMFGLMLSGGTVSIISKSMTVTIHQRGSDQTSLEELNSTLKRFWELEEVIFQ